MLLAAGSHLNLPEPQAPTTTPSAALITAARDWFAQVAPATAKPVALDWAKAHTYDGWLLISLADTTSPFAAEHKRAYRYLVAQNTSGSAFTGRIAEVVLEGKAPETRSVEQTLVAATKRLLATPQAPMPLPGITGLLIFYSPAYRSLKQYGIQQGYTLSNQFYMDMAWGGLTGTAAFLALLVVDQARINNTILTELTGRDEHGNAAQQAGTPSACR